MALLLATGCASEPQAVTDQQQREQVGRNMTALGQGLRAGAWSKVERFFSPAYHEGYGELRDRLEAQFRDERITDLQFTVNRVLESDGLINAQVHWRKTWVDKTGKPAKAEGLSEFILKPQGRAYRILRISGDRLF
ncbi:MAG: hypothetical protein B7Y41_15940 [Hydrogenophilales bacterium 28-61-23]|nr:MAG: hypothetical protein B7Y41_15940 [Hydrogenophilales bacterium 28-61-23]